jgi:hypothetical protein
VLTSIKAAALLSECSPGKPVSAFASIDDLLDLPVRKIDCRDFSVLIARHVRGLTVWREQHFLSPHAYVDRMRNFHRL